MIYILDGDTEYNTPEDIAEDCYSEDDYNVDEFDEYLNECYGRIDICGFSYSAATALYEVNQDDYYEAFDDYKRQRLEYDTDECVREVRDMEPGDELDINGHTITCADEEDEEETEEPMAIDDLLNS